VTRRTGQIAMSHAIVGVLTVAAVALATVGALSLLVQRDEQLPALGAPAREEADDICPAPLDGGDTPVTVAADDLVECPSAYDGALVRYEGEAVRAILRRGARAWLHLNDDPYALDLGPLYEHRTAVGGNSGIPVSVPAGVAEAVKYVGDARHRGDRLAVTGTFHRADPADGGGPTIQAQTARVTRVGQAADRPFHLSRALTAAALSVVAATVALLARPSVR